MQELTKKYETSANNLATAKEAEVDGRVVVHIEQLQRLSVSGDIVQRTRCPCGLRIFYSAERTTSPSGERRTLPPKPTLPKQTPFGR